MNTRTPIKASIKKEVMSRFQCANSPLQPAPGCKGYKCPLWISYYGYFDESGKQIDHIVEVTHGGTNELSNLQALCPCCHSVKTKRCAHQNWKFTSNEIDFGCAKMEDDTPSLKRQKR